MEKLYGNTKGIKRTVLQELEDLCGSYDKRLLIDRATLLTICRITQKINREICVFISRAGEILSVGVGDNCTVSLADINLKRGDRRFSGVRCVHTHPSGNGHLSDLDLSALKNMRLDLMAAVGEHNGQPKDIEIAYISKTKTESFYFKNVKLINDDELLLKISDYERVSVVPETEENKKASRSAVLVNVSTDNAEVEIKELRRLADTMEIKIAGEIIQKQQPDKTFCAGRGKLDEIKRIVQVENAEFVIFNNRLSGSQLNNVEEYVGAKTIDRAMLILEIFARHATTNEGKLQVELAMLKYTLPKLLGQGKALSRIGGGGGGAGGSATRGSGETKLETDRRKIRRTIFELTEKIEILGRERDLRRDRRRKSGIKTVAIVGYTNAGKSTLMNTMTKAGVTEADKLFATLDPVTRKIFVDIGKEYLLTDTVGFIDNLPHEFIDAFKSTLEEAACADLLLHVADCSSEDIERQERVVIEVLKSLGVTDTPIITVYNKEDINGSFSADKPDSVVISAKTGSGISDLKKLISQKLFGG